MNKPPFDQGPDYERGFIDGMQHQMQSSVDKAVNAMTRPTYYIPSKNQRIWVGLTDEGYSQLHDGLYQQGKSLGWVVDQIEEKLKERNL